MSNQKANAKPTQSQLPYERKPLTEGDFARIREARLEAFLQLTANLKSAASILKACDGVITNEQREQALNDLRFSFRSALTMAGPEGKEYLAMQHIG